MRHTQKRRFASAAACLTIALTAVVWSVAVTEMADPPEGDEVRGGLESAASLIKLKDALHEPVLKFADKKDPQQSPLEVIGGDAERLKRAPGGGEESLSQPATELSQWELSESFEIAIPSIGVPLTPVYVPSRRYWDVRDWLLLEEQMQKGLLHGAVTYPHTAMPGRRGTIFVAGHSSPPSDRSAASPYGTLFSRLPELSIGDRIEITRDGTAVIYEVRDFTVVPPTAISILSQQRQDSVLKLITCYPVGTTKDRMVVTAVRVS